MENVFMLGALVLALANLSFALHWRGKAKAADRRALGMALQLARQGPQSFADGWTHGLKQGVGGMHRAALMASSDEALFAALRATGRRLLNDPSAFEEDPDVKVLGPVYDQTR
jgi:hypothetical protein